MLCPDCNVNYVHSGDSTLFCPKCGVEIDASQFVENHSVLASVDHNTSNNSWAPFKMVGKGAGQYNRSMMKTCADYSAFRKSNNKKELLKTIYDFKGPKIPKNVANLASEMFDGIKQKGYVFRSNCKKGVMAACLYYACFLNGITKPPKDIAEIMGINEKYLSQGDRTLQSLKMKGEIDIPTIDNINTIDHYLIQYFTHLKIDKKYLPFVKALIMRARKKRIHVNNESRTTTKCVGATYMLITRLKLDISRELIVEKCSVSKATFMGYYDLLNENYKVLKHVFKKYEIPMSSAWKEN